MQRVNSDAFKLAWGEVCKRGAALAVQKHHLVQIWQAALAAKLEGSSDDSSSGGAIGSSSSRVSSSSVSSSSVSSSSSSKGAAAAAARLAQQGEGTAQLLAAAEAAFVGEAASLRGQVCVCVCWVHL